VADVLARADGPWEAAVAAAPDADWLSLLPRASAELVDILTGASVAGFATVRDADGTVLGVGHASVTEGWAGLTSLVTAPAARRRGVGTAVVRALLSWAAEEGATRMYLQVLAANTGARSLYARLGVATHHPYCYRMPA
jgi:N-acetylglutamate synthase